MYEPSLAVLGSRDHMCINDSINQLNGAQLNTACKWIWPQCEYYTNLDSEVKSPGILDIEDLAKYGVSHSTCPYYHSKQLS